MCIVYAHLHVIILHYTDIICTADTATVVHADIYCCLTDQTIGKTKKIKETKDPSQNHSKTIENNQKNKKNKDLSKMWTTPQSPHTNLRFIISVATQLHWLHYIISISYWYYMHSWYGYNGAFWHILLPQSSNHRENQKNQRNQRPQPEPWQNHWE